MNEPLSRTVYIVEKRCAVEKFLTWAFGTISIDPLSPVELSNRWRSKHPTLLAVDSMDLRDGWEYLLAEYRRHGIGDVVAGELQWYLRDPSNAGLRDPAKLNVEGSDEAPISLDGVNMTVEIDDGPEA